MLVRTWDKEFKEMKYVDNLYWFEENGIQNFDGCGHYSDYDIMFGIRLKGNDFYHGDILTMNNKPFRNGAEDLYYGIVEWRDDMGIFSVKAVPVSNKSKLSRIIDSNLLYTYDVSMFIKIGNIYENADLLSQIDNSGDIPF